MTWIETVDRDFFSRKGFLKTSRSAPKCAFDSAEQYHISMLPTKVVTYMKSNALNAFIFASFEETALIPKHIVSHRLNRASTR